MQKEGILIIGAGGQVGSELVVKLRELYSPDQVIATDIKDLPDFIKEGGPTEKLDVTNKSALKDIIEKYNVKQVYNLVAMLSATAEKHPMAGWDLNMNGLLYNLELARELEIKKIFWPSSIAVFGPTTPRDNTPQDTIMDPVTVYGISKLAGERWCEYYYRKYGVDTRSIRYPGLISYKTLPGGGTTDYAIDIFHQAIKEKHYECFLKEDTTLPMLYMEDAIKGTVDLMEKPATNLTVRSSYNLAGFSFSPAELGTLIKKQIPDFQLVYNIDFRQKIAEGWPKSIDDSKAREDWGWKPNYSLEEMVNDMLKNIKILLKQEA